jgi:hypothetical protein
MTKDLGKRLEKFTFTLNKIFFLLDQNVDVLKGIQIQATKDFSGLEIQQKIFI